MLETAVCHWAEVSEVVYSNVHTEPGAAAIETVNWLLLQLGLISSGGATTVNLAA